MAGIFPRELPEAGSIPTNTAIIIDNGTNVLKASPQQIVDAARPIASEGEAQIGDDNAKLMTPLRVKQAIEEQAVALSTLTAETGADLVGTPEGTVAEALSARPTASDLASPNGAAGVGVQLDVEGAVPRTVQDKLRDVVSVKDFGAVGDGVTDDTAALQAAFDEAASAKVLLNFVAGKTYLTTAELSMPSYLRIRGHKAKIKVKANSNLGIDNANYAPGGAVMHAYDASWVEVEGLEIDCNADNSGAMFGIYIRQGANNTVRNSYVHDSRATGIIFDGSNYGNIISNQVINCGRPTTLSGGTSSQDHGITVQAIDAIDSLGVIVQGNLVVGANRKGITSYSQNSGTVRGLVVSNNITRACLLGGIFVGSGPSATMQESITITGNVTDACYVDIEISRLGSGTVTGNTSTNAEFAGITIDDSEDVVFSGNSVKGAGLHGITAIGCQRISITANNVFQSGRLSGGYAAGIRLFNTTASSVTGNRVSDTEGKMSHGVIEENAGCDNNFIGGNLVTDATASLYLISGAGTVLQSGANIQTIDGYKVGANQVIGTRGAAVPDATDAATAITQLNTLLARLRAHGLIAS